MIGHVVRTSLSAGLIVALAGCSDPVALLPHDDVDRARRDWLEERPERYTFELAIASSWFPRSGYYRVRVEGEHVMSATDPAGVPIADFSLTIDAIWSQILEARALGRVNDVVFDRRGIPLETDLGDWALDSGVRYSVRDFSPER